MDIEIDRERIAREKIIAEVMASHLNDRPDSTDYLNWAVGIAHEVANSIAAHEREQLIEFRPNLGFDSDEPSIAGLVRRYYATHFEPEEAAEWTKEYLEAIRSRGNKQD